MSELVYHYCGHKAFENIIKNKKIWLSDIMKSNDYEEINAYLKMAFDSFEKHFDLIFYSIKKSIITKEQLLSIIKNIISYHFANSYWMAMCYSDLRDDIYQWRSYAEDGNGYAIGFNFDILKNFKKEHNCISFDRIEYNEKRMLDKIDKTIFDCIKMVYSLTSGETVRDEVISKKIFPYVSVLLKEAAFYKNKGFYTERETRLVYHRTILPEQFDSIKEDSLLNYIFFSLENDVKTRIEIDIEKELKKDFNNFIQEVIIGPCNNGNINTMQLFLRKNGINQCVVNKSNISYRCK